MKKFFFTVMFGLFFGMHAALAQQQDFTPPSFSGDWEFEGNSHLEFYVAEVLKLSPGEYVGIVTFGSFNTGELLPLIGNCVAFYNK